MIPIGYVYGDMTVKKIINKKLYLCKCKCGRIKRISEDCLLNDYSSYICNHKTNIKDIRNKRFGDWLVLYPTKNGYWMCECQCESKTKREVYGTTLRSGESKSCGHETTGFKDLTNMKFGEWVVIEYVGNHYWKCKCSCENKTIRNVHRYSLLNYKSTSCGCKSVETIQKSLIKNLVTQYRTDEQIKIVSSEENMRDYITSLSYKPTIQELSTLLSLNRSSIGVYIHKYKLEDLVNINCAVSEKEKDLRRYLESIYKGTIIYNSKIIIQGKELDIYIPEKKLAIEFNGNYWHSDIFKDSNYHQEKTLACMRKDIRLVHIFEYEWDDTLQKQKIKSLIHDVICGTQRVYARSTTVKEIDNIEALDFEDKYSLLNKENASISLGCYYDNELIGIMTFKISRFKSDKQFELIRFCFKPGLTVIGAESKMLRYFLRNYNVRSIISYCDLSKFTGKSHLKIGFKTDRNNLTRPEYVWVKSDGTEIATKYEVNKSKLITLGLGTDEQTEDEIMRNSGYFKVYNSGNLKFILEYV